MLINSYYYAPHVHCLLSRHLEYDLAKMAEIGTDAVSLCIQESHLYKHSFWGWNRNRLRNFISASHRMGLKVHAVPNRWAGLTAGWLDGFNHFQVHNPDCLLRDEKGRPLNDAEATCDVRHEKVRRHCLDNIIMLFEDFGFDGLVWDEPHAPALGQSDERGRDTYHVAFANFLDELSARAKKVRPDLCVSLFIQPGQDALFRLFLETDHLEYVGSDGHVRHASHEMHRMKGTIFDAHRKVDAMLRGSGKKSLYLLEAQRHRDEDLQHYLDVIDEAFDLPMDQLMYYFSAHEMSPDYAERFDEATWNAVARVSGFTSGANPRPDSVRPH